MNNSFFCFTCGVAGPSHIVAVKPLMGTTRRQWLARGRCSRCAMPTTRIISGYEGRELAADGIPEVPHAEDVIAAAEQIAAGYEATKRQSRLGGAE